MACSFPTHRRTIIALCSVGLYRDGIQDSPKLDHSSFQCNINGHSLLSPSDDEQLRREVSILSCRNFRILFRFGFSPSYYSDLLLLIASSSSGLSLSPLCRQVSCPLTPRSADASFLPLSIFPLSFSSPPHMPSRCSPITH